MTDIAELNTCFGIPGALTFGEYGGVGIAEVTAAHGKATIALQGAQVIAWAPDGEKPVIWLSNDAQFKPGKSVRGGAPVCWPWFGPHAAESGYPAHGYARTVPWRVTKAGPMIDGRVRVAFELIENDITRRLWPHQSPVELHITVGNTLELELVTRNAGNKALTIGEALHTYFAVGDVRKVRIDGLDGAEYLDKVGAAQRRQQIGPVSFTGETDRIYLNTEAECIINDAEWQRRIHITKAGSRSTVVWNPWLDKARKMGDMGEDGYLGMVCVESANAADNVVTLAPGAEHRLSVAYRVER